MVVPLWRQIFRIWALIDGFSPAVQAGLSQNAPHHKNNLRQGNWPAFNQTGHHFQVSDQRAIHIEHRRFAAAIAAGILLLLLDFSLRGPIVGGASFCRIALSSHLATSKRTINIVAVNIARMGQKDDAAVPAALQAGVKVAMLSNNPSKGPNIDRRCAPNPFFSIPVRRKLKKPLKLYDKKAKSGLVWLIKLDIPSFLFRVFRKFMNKRGYFFCKAPFVRRWVNLAQQTWVNLAQRYRLIFICC
jgi:hypothetical protein